MQILLWVPEVLLSLGRVSSNACAATHVVKRAGT